MDWCCRRRAMADGCCSGCAMASGSVMPVVMSTMTRRLCGLRCGSSGGCAVGVMSGAASSTSTQTGHKRRICTSGAISTSMRHLRGLMYLNSINEEGRNGETKLLSAGGVLLLQCNDLDRDTQRNCYILLVLANLPPASFVFTFPVLLWQIARCTPYNKTSCWSI